MKALTICQPYAHLIVQGRKTCENRTWPTNYRGPLYIHAGKSRQWLNLDEDGTDEGIPVDRMAFGAVVAVCNLVACLHIDSRLLPEWTAKMTDEQRGHVSGDFCWIVSNVTPIGPWPWRGAQGLFDIAEEELGRVANRELGIVTHRDEVMNPPASAAQGAEARNLNTSQRHGSGAEPQGSEAQATQHSAAPIGALDSITGNNND